MVALSPPIRPMLAKAIGDQVSPNEDRTLSYEPKWDGFRCLLFRNGAEVVRQSRSGEDLPYCFPEITEAAARLQEGVALDGELVVPGDGRLWFERLTMRIRPRSEEGGWKIRELPSQYPCSYVAFDVLAVRGESVLDSPFRDRRETLKRLDWTKRSQRSGNVPWVASRIRTCLLMRPTVKPA